MPVDNAFERYRRAPGALQDHNDIPVAPNRFLGGKGRTNQYYVGGYFYPIISPPDHIFNGKSVNPAEGAGLGALSMEDSSNALAFEQWVLSTCEGFTPHSVTPGVVEVVGMGGMGASFMNGRNDVTREFGVTFREIQNLPLIQSMQLWASFANAHYGISSVEGDEFIPKNYKGDAYIIICRPTVSGANREITERDVEQIFYYDGVFPKSVPLDQLNQDLQSNETIQLSVQFSFDGYPVDKSDRNMVIRALEELNNRMSWMQHYNRHYNPDTAPYVKDNSHGYSMFGTRNNSRNPGRGTWG